MYMTKYATHAEHGFSDDTTDLLDHAMLIFDPRDGLKWLPLVGGGGGHALWQPQGPAMAAWYYEDTTMMQSNCLV